MECKAETSDLYFLIRVKEFFVLIECVSVRHAGDIIADNNVFVIDRIDPVLIFRRQHFNIFYISEE